MGLNTSCFPKNRSDSSIPGPSQNEVSSFKDEASRHLTKRGETVSQQLLHERDCFVILVFAWPRAPPILREVAVEGERNR